jgi:hypothetical protein
LIVALAPHLARSQRVEVAVSFLGALVGLDLSDKPHRELSQD